MGYIVKASLKGRGNQYIQLVKATTSSPHEVRLGFDL